VATRGLRASAVSPRAGQNTRLVSARTRTFRRGGASAEGAVFRARGTGEKGDEEHAAVGFRR
jgi:hypothetical protein